ncbi:hypothetical protein AGMMS4952_09350 [Spirochaetia bacterium]|nr:hypothetical protein AGMMS4952_09350 [Spirochaetia bacterium]
MKEIGVVDYWKCKNCGFVSSKTYQELPFKKWEKLNSDFHHFGENLKSNNDRLGNQPPYLQQATMLNILQNKKIINPAKMLDYAGGYGTLSKILEKYYGLGLLVYDPYIQTNETNYVLKEQLEKYKVVINSAMFEHVISRQDLDNVNDLVDMDGCLVLHTRICEEIPKDPDWFYVLPVHCAFHTNMSMEILMRQWKYESSIYCPVARCWVLFKKDRKDFHEIIKKINLEFEQDYLFYKKGFLDYWKTVG